MVVVVVVVAYGRVVVVGTMDIFLDNRIYYFIMLKAKKIHYCSICVGKIDKITFGGIKKLNI